MSTSQHQAKQYELAELMERAAKRVVIVGYTCTETDEAVGGSHFEEDGEDAVAGLAGYEGIAFDDADEEEGDEDVPKVVDEDVTDVLLGGYVLVD